MVGFGHLIGGDFSKVFKESETVDFALLEPCHLLFINFKLMYFPLLFIQTSNHLLVGLLQNNDDLVFNFVLKVYNLSLSRRADTIGSDVCLRLLTTGFDLVLFELVYFKTQLFGLVLFLTHQPLIFISQSLQLKCAFAV